MPINALLGGATTPPTPLQVSPKQSSSGPTASRFAATFAGVMNGVTLSDAQIKKSFASTNTAGAFAKQAASMGLNESQIQHAMQICGYGSADPNVSKSDIENWVANAGNGFAWDANGALTEVQSATTRVQGASVQATGGMTIAGHFVSTQQIKDFYAQGGNANEILQRNGITNPWEIGAINAQAIQLSGVKLTPQENLQNYFKEYQKYNPNGKHASDFAGFVEDQDPLTKMNMGIGQYSGPVTALADFEPGGIYGPNSTYYGQAGYGSGLGPRGIGDLGGGWAQSGAAGAIAGTQKPV